MPTGTGTSDGSLNVVPTELLEATRSLLWVHDEADVHHVAAELVRALGGTLVAADEDDGHALPVDVSFGSGAPLLPVAPAGSAARALLERHLTTFLLDARRALELAGRTHRLAEAAATDVLTGLPNRRMLGRAIGRLTDGDAVVMIDLDHFKRVNDELGHAAGDAVLRAFGTLLRAQVRGRDTVGRYGGEEFLVVLSPAGGADHFLGRLREAWLVARPHAITFSAGVAEVTGDPDESVRRADEALYVAKGSGRDRWVWAAGAVAQAEQR